MDIYVVMTGECLTCSAGIVAVEVWVRYIEGRG